MPVGTARALGPILQPDSQNPYCPAIFRLPIVTNSHRLTIGASNSPPPAPQARRRNTAPLHTSRSQHTCTQHPRYCHSDRYQNHKPGHTHCQPFHQHLGTLGQYWGGAASLVGKLMVTHRGDLAGLGPVSCHHGTGMLLLQAIMVSKNSREHWPNFFSITGAAASKCMVTSWSSAMQHPIAAQPANANSSF